MLLKKIPRMNKKGQVGNSFGVFEIGLFVGLLFLLVVVGMVVAFGGLTLDWVFDEAVPEFSNIGQVGSSNFTEYAGYTVTPLNNVVQQFSWMAGLIYAMALISMLGFATVFKITGNKWMMVLFFLCMFLLVISCIFVSNIYEDFYDDSGEVSDRLHEYGLLSFMILYSPMIMCVVGFIGGVIMFAGNNQEGEI